MIYAYMYIIYIPYFRLEMYILVTQHLLVEPLKLLFVF